MMSTSKKTSRRRSLTHWRRRRGGKRVRYSGDIGKKYRKRMMEMEHRIARLRRKVRLKSSSGSKRIHANTKRIISPSSSNGTCSWQRPCSTGGRRRAMDENRGSCQHPQRFSCGCTHSASDRSPGVSIFSEKSAQPVFSSGPI